MRQIINEASLNGCGLALNHQHGSYLRDRINIICLVLISFVAMTLQAYSAEGAIDRSSIGEITDYSGGAEVVHSSANINDGMQTGGKIYPNDIIKTRTGSVEIVFGINSRIRLGSNTELRVDSLDQKSTLKSNLLHSTSNYKLILKRGVVRVRVRENFITSTLITIIAGDIKVIAPRSDLIVSRGSQGSKTSYIGVLIAWGRALVNKKNVNDEEWNINNEKEVGEGYNSLIEERDIADESIKWEMIGVEKAREAVRELPFSVDKNIAGFDNIPDVIPELQGA